MPVPGTPGGETVPEDPGSGETIPNMIEAQGTTGAYIDLRGATIFGYDEFARRGQRDIPATKPLLTLFDLWRSEELPLEVIRFAFQSAMDLGKITHKELSKAAKDMEWAKMAKTLGVKT